MRRHRLYFGKDWPNIMFGPHHTLDGMRSFSTDRPYLCRLELDTPLTETEADRLSQDLSNGSKQDAIATVVAARHFQGLPRQEKAVAAFMETTGDTVVTPPEIPFSIRVEALLDHGNKPLSTATVKFALDVYLEDLPLELTPDVLEQAVRTALSGSENAKKIFRAFKAAFTP